MIFKANWEKTQTQHHLSGNLIKRMLFHAYPNNPLKAFEVIEGGCANLNIKVQLEKIHSPRLLRVYMREPEAAYREQKISLRLKKHLPVSELAFIGEQENYVFAIMTFLPGITLRDLLLKEENYNLNKIMFQTGELLSKIAKHQFKQAGFFDKTLNISKPLTQDTFITYIHAILKKEPALSILSPAQKIEILTLISDKKHLFPNGEEKNLVHADFDPANILVKKFEKTWEISGILDWEFAFSGSTLCDVANMLRYAHQMPKAYTNAFLDGLKFGGYQLPKNWQETTWLLDLTALLGCLERADPKNRPHQLEDIHRLITRILSLFQRQAK